MYKQGDVIIKRNVDLNGSMNFFEVIMVHKPHPEYEAQVACTRVDDPRPEGAREVLYFNLDEVMLLGAQEELEKSANPRPDYLENDMVKHPNHYTAGGIETREFIKAKLNAMPHLTPWQAYCIGTAMKYPTRAGLKDLSKFKEDLRKAITYLEWAMED